MESKELNFTEQLEMKFWCDVYVGVATSSNCINKETPKIWADIALKEFKLKFSEKP